MNKLTSKILICCCLGFTACGSSHDNDKGGSDADNDAGQVDSATSDVAPKDEAPPLDDPSDAQADVQFDAEADARADAQADVADDDASTEWVIRKPKQDVLCNTEYGIGTPQIDHVCTYDYDGVKGLIYVQTTPIECVGVCAGPCRTVSSEVELALIKIDDTVEKLSNVTYDSDGNHVTDRLTFDYKNVRFVYSHSSINGAYMSCQNMHCAIIKDTDGKLIENGCRPKRTRPIVCKRVAEDGTYDESMEDTFAVCPDDPGTNPWDPDY